MSKELKIETRLRVKQTRKKGIYSNKHMHKSMIWP